MKENKDLWVESPITKRKEVLVEYDDKQGESKMCIGSGFFTNENFLNYKKHPEFDIEAYESKMPELFKELRFDDGESYWYPCTIQTDTAMVFPNGTKENWKWCYAEIKALEEKVEGYESKLDIGNSKQFDRFLDASKEINGFSLGEFS